MHLLHHHTAAAALLWRVRILALGNRTPDARHHVVPRAVAVRDDALRRLAHGDTLALEILTQPGIEFGQTTELEVGHALLILLDRSRVADLAGSVLRHLGRRGGGNACGRGVGVALSRENGF